MNKWQTPDSIPVKDEKMEQFSVDVEVLIPEMDEFGAVREVKRMGYYHLQAHIWLIFDKENTPEVPCSRVLAWRYIL